MLQAAKQWNKICI